LVVLAIHVVFYLLFAVLRGPTRDLSEADAPATTLIFVPEVVKPVESTSAPAVAGRVRRRPPPRAGSPPQPEPDSAITPAPDWRAEAGIAANNVLEAERRKHANPSVLEPHDFSGATPGSTDLSKPKFGWSHASTQRVQVVPGGVVLNVTDRCAIGLLFLVPLIGCQVGHIEPQGNLFEHLHDPPAPKTPNLP
jgi:hypothetical protein